MKFFIIAMKRFPPSLLGTPALFWCRKFSTSNVLSISIEYFWETDLWTDLTKMRIRFLFGFITRFQFWSNAPWFMAPRVCEVSLSWETKTIL